MKRYAHITIALNDENLAILHSVKKIRPAVTNIEIFRLGMEAIKGKGK